MSSLPEFFAAIVPMLRGDLEASGVEARLGRSTSGSERLAFYRTLMRRNVRLILRDVFPATRRAVLALDDGLWDRLAERFDQKHPADHWDPNQFARPFPTFLSELTATRELPSYLEELADYEWIRYEVGVAPDDPAGAFLERTVFVREYEHDVIEYCRTDDTTHPIQRTTRVVVFRSPEDGWARFFRPNPFELAAIAAQSGVPVPEGVPRAELERVERRLEALGVLPRAQT